ncbi:unnamed protein product, partial [Heterosigma akashiwo]
HGLSAVQLRGREAVDKAQEDRRVQRGPASSFRERGQHALVPGGHPRDAEADPVL